MGKNSTRTAALIATAFIGVQPCSAADHAGGAGPKEMRTSAFAGLNVRLPLGAAREPKPVARLQLTTSYTMDDRRTGVRQVYKPQGLELGADRAGRLSVYAGGQSTSDIQKKMGVYVSRENTYYIIGAVVLSVAVIAFLASNGPSSPGG